MGVALQAATGGNRQRWRWVLVFDEEKRRRIGEYYATAFREILNVSTETAAAAAPAEEGYHADFKRRVSEDDRLEQSVSYLIENMGRAPVLVLACVVGRVAPTDTPHWMSAQFGSVYPAVWNLQLALRSRGLGSCITGAHLAYEQEVAEILEIPYETVMQVCLLPVAYHLGDGFNPARRRPMDEVVFVDAFPAGTAQTW